MRLLAIPDASGNPTIWINADHLVSVQPVYRTGDGEIRLEVEIKVDGMPLQRIQLGPHPGRHDAERAFLRFLAQLEGRDSAA